ncbi:choice-of-anchor D domain-containing protein, partial [bacterium]|nr:choice-of-anchor D domain-containing protein [bacterium]
MKNLTKALLSGALVVGMAGVSSAQYFVTTAHYITGSVNGTHPLEASVIATEINIDTFPGFPFNVHYDYDVTGVNGSTGVAYNPNAGTVYGGGLIAWNFASLGPAFSGNAGFSTYEFIHTLSQADWATPNQVVTTGVQTLPAGTTSGQQELLWCTGSNVYFDDAIPATGDLVPTSLVSTSSTNATQSYTPQIQISNLEISLTSSPPTTATMEISFGGNLIYTNTQNIPAILPASSQNFSFAPLTPYRSGTYEVLVYTELVGDANPQNDTLTTSFEVLGDVALNEFLPFGNSQFDPTFTEFFEIANATNNALNISGWQIRNSANQTITVASGTTIPANDFFVFTKYSNLLNGGLPFDYAFNPTSFTLGDATDFIVVKDAGGILVDSVFYDGSWNTVQGEAFERKNVKLDPLNALSWCKGTTVFGTENNKGTPGSASSCLSQLADGSLSVATLNFGNVALSDSSEISVTLYSSGTATLTVSSLTISGTGFSTDLTGISVASGGSANFSVKFKPEFEGVSQGNLEIFTNDWNTASYTVSLSGTGIDGIAPSQILDFRLASHSGTSLKLKWTATGDDLSSGTATSYELRRSTSEITEANFSSGTLVSNLPTPSASGTTDSVTVSGLTSGTQYYFGIKAIDNAGNTSPLSTATSFGRAEITSITDVNNDNGKAVRIVFNGNFNDYTIGTGLNTNQYAILRKVNPLYAPSGKVYTNQTLESLPSGNWEVVGSIPAFGETSYTTVVPTLADSNSTGTHEFEFLVRAVSIVSPTINSVSGVVTGYSKDNLSPPVPVNPSFTNNGNGTITANWNTVYASDLAFYTIYVQFSDESYSLVSQVVPSGSAVQSYTFSAVPNAFAYFVGSLDENGNEGLPPFDRITSLEVEVVGNDVVLSWLGKLNAVNYKIYRSVKPDLTGSVQIGTYTANGVSP